MHILSFIESSIGREFLSEMHNRQRMAGFLDPLFVYLLHSAFDYIDEFDKDEILSPEDHDVLGHIFKILKVFL